MADYDGGYHLLFSNPRLIEDLLKHFVPETWVKQLDYSSLERVNTKFHSENLTRREGDIIYRVQSFDSGSIYIYLLLEFQSQTDYWMAVRVNAYVSLLYQQLTKESRVTKETGLPPVFPVVLYNGDKPWNCPQDLLSLIAVPDHSALRAWQPNIFYYLIEERLHPIEKGDSLAGLLFEMGNCADPRQLSHVIQRLDNLVYRPEDAALRRAFGEIVKVFLSNKKGYALQINNINDLTEIHNMLSKRLEQWEASIFEKGIEQGIDKGFEQGESSLLHRQLTHRFGPLPQWAEDKLATADSTTLEKWGLACLDADSLDDVFL